MELIFASHNNKKLLEIQAIIGDEIIIKPLQSVTEIKELPEPYYTFEENAVSKASFVVENFKVNCFAEDSGLVIPYLNNEPGVFSARYAGEPTNDILNYKKVLDKLGNSEDRAAYYVSVICLNLNHKQYFFRGECHGTISRQPTGDGGFGYDPIFIPNGMDKTMASLDFEVKNQLSHRKKALEQFVRFLHQIL